MVFNGRHMRNSSEGHCVRYFDGTFKVAGSFTSTHQSDFWYPLCSYFIALTLSLKDSLHLHSWKRRKQNEISLYVCKACVYQFVCILGILYISLNPDFNDEETGSRKFHNLLNFTLQDRQ